MKCFYRIDQYYLERRSTTGDFIPPFRPREWRRKCFEVIANTVRQRIEGNQLEDRALNKQWLARQQLAFLCRCWQVMRFNVWQYLYTISAISLYFVSDDSYFQVFGSVPTSDCQRFISCKKWSHCLFSSRVRYLWSPCGDVSWNLIGSSTCLKLFNAYFLS